MPEPSPESDDAVAAEPVAPGAPEHDGEAPAESVSHPAKVMRIGSMIKQLLDEVRHAPLDEPGRARLAEIYQTSVDELSEVLSQDLKEELQRLAAPFDETTPS